MHSSPMVSFLQLPPELIWHILNFLPVIDLLQCNLVCQHLRGIIASSSALQYTIELSRCRMTSALPSTSAPSFSSRLQILRDRENAWKTLSSRSRHKLKLAHSGTVYEFAGGMYGTGKETDRRTTTFITFYDLPSVESGAQHSFTYTFPDLNIVDFTIDPAQDLLVLVSLNQDSPYLYDLHLRKLSTNEPHPKAPAPILSCFQKPDDFGGTDYGVRIQISGDVLGFLIKEALFSIAGHFEAFKWRVASPNSCKLTCTSGIDDFTFLSQDHFLIVRPSGLFEVYHFSDPIHDSSNPELRGRYALPTLSDAYSFWYISLSSNPSPGYVPGPPGEHKTYHCSPEERLHACCIYVFQPIMPERDIIYPFVFFFHPKTFLNPPSDWLYTSDTPDWTRSGTAETQNTPGPDLRRSPSTSDSSDASTPPSSPSFSSASSQVNSTAPSSVSLGGSPNNLLNFSLPQSLQPESSSMLFDISTPASSRAPTPTYTARSHSPTFPVPWDVWGPQSTRWFRECLSKDWQHSVYGLRTADCVIDRAALDELFASSQDPVGEEGEGEGSTSRTHEADDSESDHDENADGDDSDEGEDDLIFVNDVAVSTGDLDHHIGRGRLLPKFLRVRDFNPYSVSKAAEEIERTELGFGSAESDSAVASSSRIPTSSASDIMIVDSGDARCARDRGGGGLRRVVVGPSKTNVRGVFKKNIVSYLPYVETISEESFNVNEVMMDDCRLLLVKRGRGGKLKSINILTL